MVKFKSSTDAIYNKNVPVNTLKKRSNVSLTDSRGFIPLKVQIKRYMLAGVQLKTMRDQYTCEDYLEAYKDIECITEDMDITEIQETVRHVNTILESRRIEREQAEERAEFSTAVVKSEALDGAGDFSTTVENSASSSMQAEELEKKE